MEEKDVIISGNIVLTDNNTALFSLMRWVVLARRTEAGWEHQSGMRIEKDGGQFRFVCTDGRRMHILTAGEHEVGDAFAPIARLMEGRTEYDMGVEKVTAKEVIFGGVL